MRRLFAGAMLAAMATASAQAQVVNQDPAGSSPLVAAMEWIQGTLLGNVATAAAVIAVAVVGFMMLTGRIEWRRGLTVVIGCFIIFGAVAIVSGIRSLAGGCTDDGAAQLRSGVQRPDAAPDDGRRDLWLCGVQPDRDA